jgi:hypothetical protein
MWISAHKTFISQPIHTLVLYVFLFKDTQFSIHCWFINTEFPSESTIAHGTCILSSMHMMAFLCLEASISTLTQCLGVILSNDIAFLQKSTRMWQQRGLKRHTCLQWGAETRRAVWPQLGMPVLGKSFFFRSSALGWEWLRTAGIDFGVTNQV